MQSGSKVTLNAAEGFISKNLSYNPLSCHFLYTITQDISGSIKIQRHHHCCWFLIVVFFLLLTNMIIYLNTGVGKDANVSVMLHLEGLNYT